MHTSSLIRPRALRAALAIALVAGAGAACADPPQASAARCTPGGITGHAFTQLPPGRAEYRFSGACSTRDGDALAYRVTGTWTGASPSGNPGDANASEIYQVDRVSGRSQSYTGIIGFRCPADPWLNDVECTRVGDDLPDELSQFWQQLGAGSSPTSRRGLPADQRSALQAEYDRANGLVLRNARAGDRVDARRGSAAGTTAAKPDLHPRSAQILMLNPQPLPPVEDGDVPTTPVASPVQGDGSAAAIIIVGGKLVSTPVPTNTGTPARVTPSVPADAVTPP